MAVVYAAIVSLMNTIHEINTHPRLSTSLQNAQTQTLLEKCDLQLDFIEAHNYGVGSKEAEDLEKHIASAAYAAEDAIESHIVDQIHAGTYQASLHLQYLIESLDAIIKKANEVKANRGLKEERRTHLAASPRMESVGFAMVGFEDELIRLLDELTGNRSNRHTISIVGMGGMGKTTLAKTVYTHSLIKHHFDIRAWATITENYDVNDVLSQLVYGQTKSSDGNADDLGLQLHKSLTGRRYLIVLDDIWSVDVWDKVRCFFPDNGNGSRVVVTTRMSNVAVDCGSSILKKNLLNEDESWRLFCEKAFQGEDCPELEEVGKEIVDSCKGLPLSIVVIGGSLLKSPRTTGHWEDVARDIKSTSDSKEKQESLDVLISSYNHLPPHLKPCFLYIGVYKWHYSKIPISDIIRLWVAEGFLKSNGTQVLEEIAEGYIQDLIDRNLISVGRRSHIGKLKTCDIHDLLTDLCMKLGEQQGFVHVTESDIVGNHRRLIYSEKCWFLETGSPFARSIMAYMVLEKATHEFRLLRILKLCDQLNATDDLFRCVNLRYINASFLGELPSSMSLPWSLQTLIYTGFPTTFNAPIEIWTLQQLRHLECTLIYLPDPCQHEHEFVILEKLQTLKTAVNFKLSEEVCKLIPNIKSLRILYTVYDDGYDDSLVDCLHNLGHLQRLESLSLTVNSAVYSRLTDVKLTLSKRQKKLSLHHCKPDMRMIGSLPLLEVLKLDSLCQTEEEEWEWSPVEGEFPRLKVLKINVSCLKQWNDDACSQFPVLEKLFLGSYIEWEEIPWSITEIPTLELIRLERGRMSAAISAVRIREERLEYDDNDDLQIQLQLYAKDVESFRGMVETEGLTLDNIQLEIYCQ